MLSSTPSVCALVYCPMTSRSCSPSSPANRALSPSGAHEALRGCVDNPRSAVSSTMDLRQQGWRGSGGGTGWQHGTVHASAVLTGRSADKDGRDEGMNDGEEDESEAGGALMISCAHGTRPSAVVCRHLLTERERPADLQAWCGECEKLFLDEGGEMTTRFREFNDFALVCDLCDANIKISHAKGGTVHS
jgi:hypothetical protein